MLPGGEGGWRRVRWLERWDVGEGAGRPGFAAPAWDGRVAVVAASYEGGAGVHAVRRPGGVTGRRPLG